MSPREQAAILRVWVAELERQGSTADLALRQALEAGAWALDLCATLIATLADATPDELRRAAGEFTTRANRSREVIAAWPHGAERLLPSNLAGTRRWHVREEWMCRDAALLYETAAKAMEASPAEVQS